MWEPRKLFGTYTYNPDCTKTYTVTAKSRFYDPTGAGRDDYIFRSNGGLYPQHDACKIDEKGEFLFQKQRYIDTIPTIHSKSVMYYANGTGRDSYIINSAGGFTKLNVAGECRSTFYNGLRQHSDLYTPKRCKSTRATKTMKTDFYTKTQDYKGHNHFVAQNYYRKYQKNLDGRLAVPKKKRNIMVLK